MNSRIYKELLVKFNKTDEQLSEFEMTMINFAMFDASRGHKSLFNICDIAGINQFFAYCDHKQYDYFNAKPFERWRYESEFLNAIRKPVIRIPFNNEFELLGGDWCC